MHAFYLEPEKWQELVLTGSEFHHLSKVLRLKAGEQITLLDGKGKEAVCTIKNITKKEAELAICSEKVYPLDEILEQSGFEIAPPNLYLHGSKYQHVFSFWHRRYKMYF